jgi:hypothetical protein
LLRALESRRLDPGVEHGDGSRRGATAPRGKGDDDRVSLHDSQCAAEAAA